MLKEISLNVHNTRGMLNKKIIDFIKIKLQCRILLKKKSEKFHKLVMGFV
jgi:hypothetical protein